MEISIMALETIITSVLLIIAINIEELKQDIVNMQLHIDTDPYYCKLDTIKLLDDFSDVHEGVWFPVCDVLNKENKVIDVFIVEEFYS